MLRFPRSFSRRFFRHPVGGTMDRRTLGIAAAVLCLGFVLPISARAQDEEHATHKSSGIGFHETVAPLGIRHWFGSQKVGLDLGVGFSSEPSLEFPGEH